jgi:hypothetical protein
VAAAETLDSERIHPQSVGSRDCVCVPETGDGL